MPCIERVITKHIQSLCRHGLLHHLCNVAIVPKRHMQVVQPTVRLIDAVLRLIERVMKVRVFLKVFGENNRIGVSASGRESISNNSPLRLSIQAEYLSQIMNKSGQDKPTRMSITANRL